MMVMIMMMIMMVMMMMMDDTGKKGVTHMCDTYNISARKATGGTVGRIILAMMTMLVMRTAATMTIEAMPQQSCTGMMSESSILLMSCIRCVFS